jgi:hypothetical protein
MDAIVQLVRPETAGYIASALVFLTFCMKTLLPLRVIAIASNLAFVVYGIGAELLPILILHCALLPLNIWRTVQYVREIRQIRQSARGQPKIETLLPFMTRKRFDKDTVLFRKSDIARSFYYIKQGTILIPEIGKQIGPGELVGEIGIFAPNHKRTASAICLVDCELSVISEDDIFDLFTRDPHFGIYMIKLITERMQQSQRKTAPTPKTGVLAGERREIKPKGGLRLVGLRRQGR